MIELAAYLWVKEAPTCPTLESTLREAVEAGVPTGGSTILRGAEAQQFADRASAMFRQPSIVAEEVHLYPLTGVDRTMVIVISAGCRVALGFLDAATLGTLRGGI